MKLHSTSKLCAWLLASAMLVGTTPVTLAAEAEPLAEGITVVLTDVTSTDPTTLEGEAKIKVSVEGVEGSGSIAQMYLDFSGDLKYKSITFLQGENNPPAGLLISPNAALANSKKEIVTSIIAMDESLEFSDTTDLFVLTFAGEPGDTVKLTLNDLENSWVLVDGNELPVKKTVSKSATATDEAKEGITASITLSMDVVTDFTGPKSSGYKDSGINLTITSKDNEGYTIHTVLNNANISAGGHRVGSGDSSVPTFIIENTVLKGDKYDLEISGIGYAPYILEDVDFEDEIEITNADFVPGDVNGDGEVTVEDKELCNELIAEKEFSEAGDFNRDGKVDKYDLAVFDNIEDDEEEKATAPDKINDLTVTGGDKKLTLSWTKPDDGGSAITGYKIIYGTEDGHLDSEATAPANATSYEITELTAGTRYFVRIAAENSVGLGEYSSSKDGTTAASGAEPGTGTKEDPTVPGVPTELSVTKKTSSTLTIKWVKPANGGSDLTGYRVQYGTDKDNLSTIKDVETNTAILRDLNASTTYYFMVAAKNKVGYSPYTELESGKTESASGGGGGGGGGGSSIGGGGGGGMTPPVQQTNYYPVTFDIGEGTLASGSLVINVAQNAKAEGAPTVTPPAGYTFEGWSRDGGATTIAPANVTVTGAITFKAVYKKVETTGTTTPGATTEEFVDLNNHVWAKESIYLLKNNGVINGTSATTFSPANNIKRGDFILILVRMLGIDAEYTENFSDVPADSYYADAIGKAKAAGIATGYEGKFRPEDSITRQDLITLAYRAFLAKGLITEATDTASLDGFADKAEITDYAVPAMSSMVKGGIIQGSDGKVNPKNNATRAEVAVMCARLWKLIK